MPTTAFRNACYRAALPLLAPSPRGRMTHAFSGRELSRFSGYERLLLRHHVLGASLLLRQGADFARVDTSLSRPRHMVQENSVFRVASITKTATALVTLMLAEDGAFSLNTPVSSLLPGGEKEPALDGVTLRHLLSHTSGLEDIPAVDEALRQGATFHDPLRAPGIRRRAPGEAFSYCNFGFGLIGCILEHASGLALNDLFVRRLFQPLGMSAALDPTLLDETRIVPISRVLPYRPGHDVTLTRLGRKPLISPDPERHFGHTPGNLYTDASSLSRMLTLIAQRGLWNGQRLLHERSIDEMTSRQATYGAASPGLSYGLGLLRIEDAAICSHLVLGHQGYAYGCVDGAFVEAETGRQVIFLNGGCSEARDHRLGLCNQQLLEWAFREEFPLWK